MEPFWGRLDVHRALTGIATGANAHVASRSLSLSFSHRFFPCGSDVDTTKPVHADDRWPLAGGVFSWPDVDANPGMARCQNVMVRLSGEGSKIHDCLFQPSRLCRAGRLYEIERWINDGKSLEIPAVITVFLQMVRPRPVILRSGLYPAAHVHLWPAIDTA